MVAGAVTEAVLWAALGDVKDPEIPSVSIVEMGLVVRVVLDAGRTLIELTPTFVGCPALDIIRRQVADRVAEAGAEDVAVKFVFDPPWTSERITPAGREKLKRFGIAPPLPPVGGSLITLDEVPACPYCGSGDTHLENLFGPTACRTICYCDACRQPFEAMKTV
ncbi:MAG TPA: 1,2-phenylacetyl-CoA epoxidase subunit PaaD [Symbiobacteriaceae bacterium]|jgi:ring-1,2-phenylacetyl-CoA epoxidase subunit PaaD